MDLPEGLTIKFTDKMPTFNETSEPNEEQVNSLNERLDAFKLEETKRLREALERWQKQPFNKSRRKRFVDVASRYIDVYSTEKKIEEISFILAIQFSDAEKGKLMHTFCFTGYKNIVKLHVDNRLYVMRCRVIPLPPREFETQLSFRKTIVVGGL